MRSFQPRSPVSPWHPWRWRRASMQTLRSAGVRWGRDAEASLGGMAEGTARKVLPSIEAALCSLVPVQLAVPVTPATGIRMEVGQEARPHFAYLCTNRPANRKGGLVHDGIGVLGGWLSIVDSLMDFARWHRPPVGLPYPSRGQATLAPASRALSDRR